MADITMCEDRLCPKKDTCYRYTAPACEYRQAYFCESPRDTKTDECNYYWKIEKKESK